MPAQTLNQKNKPKYKNQRKLKYKRNVNTSDVARIAKRIVNKSISKSIETKHYNNTEGAYDVPATGQIFQFTQMIQGTRDFDIVGTKARLTSLYFKYQINLADQFNVVRLVIFQDLDFEDTPPTVNDLFPNLLITSTASMYDPDTVPSRYKILMDRTIVLDTDDNVSVGFYKTRELSPIEFYGNPTTASTQAKGHIYLCAFSDSGVAGHPILMFDSMLYYKDA